jgi:hypothetical protein
VSLSALSADRAAALAPDLPAIIEFANSIARESVMDDTVVRNCVNVLGDVCMNIRNAGTVFNNSSKDWQQLVVYCQDSGHLLGDTDWAIAAVQKSLNDPEGADFESRRAPR